MCMSVRKLNACKATYRRFICAIYTILILLLGPLALVLRLKVRLHLAVWREVRLSFGKCNVCRVILLRLLLELLFRGYVLRFRPEPPTLLREFRFPDVIRER